MATVEVSDVNTHFELAPEASLKGYRLKSFSSVGSTNAEALDSAQDGDPGLHWFVTALQESGRGRRGRKWTAPEGNLAATLLVVDSFDPKIAATLGFVAGLSLIDAIEAVLPPIVSARVKLALKWPNDVLLDGAKLSGILLESSRLPNGKFGIAVGMGTNVVAAPDGLAYPAASLKEAGCAVNASTLFLALSDAWCHYYTMWNGGRGLASIRSNWLESAYGIGEPVAVRFNERIIEGVFETIDSECRFVIREEDGTRTTITAGDVYFGNVASAKAVF